MWSRYRTGDRDEVLDKLDDIYGFVPPLADFAANNPYQRFNKQIQGSVSSRRKRSTAWNDSRFVFTPPQGAEKIKMVTVEEGGGSHAP